MKKSLFLVVLTLISLPVFALKIAVIDMKTVWENSKAIKQEKQKMEKLVKESQDKLKKKEAELKALQDKARKEAPMATDEAKQAMAQEYQKKAMELQQLYQVSQRDLQNKDVTVQADFIEKVKKIADSIGKKRGYDIILPKEQVLYIKNTYDITKDIIKLVNK